MPSFRSPWENIVIRLWIGECKMEIALKQLDNKLMIKLFDI
jgi:hypothetical protein